MSYISKIDLSTAPQEIRAAVDNHLAQGYQLTNEKLTLLHNVTAFHTLEESSYELDRELQRLIGKRAADFYEYAISLQNDCLVCSAYFSRLLEKNHIDFATFDFTDDERLLIEYGRAIARDPKHVPEDLMRLMQQTFTEEQLVVITTMGVFMIANNYFNDITSPAIHAVIIHSFAILRVLKSIHTAPVATVSTRQCCKDILSLTSRFVWVNLIVRSL